MRFFTKLSLAACLAALTAPMLAAPANADPLKGSEILRHVPGDWDYVYSPDFKIGPDFCKSSRNRMWMDGTMYRYRSIRSDKPEDYFSITSGQLSMVEPETLLIRMELPPSEPPGNIRIGMQSQDFMVLQIRNSPLLYFKRCPSGERIS
jgi:hypothetical protein